MSRISSAAFATRAAVVAVLVGAAIAPAATRASALPTPPETSWGAIVACGYGSSLPVLGSIGSTCESLPQAVTDAETLGGTFASAPPIVLMPGDYCPISLPKLGWALTITGMGWAGIDTSGGPVSFDGSEAELSTFKYDSDHCTGSTNGLIDNTLGPTTQGLDLQNLALEGSTGGPGYGIYSNSSGSALTLRDVLIKGVSTIGVYYTGAGVDITHSALIDDGSGAYLPGVNSGDIYASTVADNVNYGVEIGNADFNFDDSTISHNGTGLRFDGNVNDQGDGVILAGNDIDCSSSGWENVSGVGGSANGSGYNLLGNCSPAGTDATDIAYNGTDHPIPDVADNGGPTPSIAPTSQAIAAMTPITCFEEQDSDQREYIWDPNDATQPTCDIGAVQSAATTASDIDPSGTGDFGNVVVGSSSTNAFYVQNDLSGMFSVISVSTTGSAFSVTGDGCTQNVVFKEEGGYCRLTVQAAPTQVDSTPETGTLKVLTSLGEKDVALSVNGTANAVTAPGAPTGLHGTAGDGKVSLGWTAPVDNGGAAIASYEIDDSINSGSSWSQVGQVGGSTLSDDITGLTDGTVYQFRVLANNGTASSDPSNVITLTPAAPTTRGTPTLTAPKKATVAYRKAVTLQTTVKVGTLPVPNTGIQLQKQVPGSSSWTSAGTVPTNTSGVATKTIRPTRTLNYRWAFLGNLSLNPAASSTAKIQVAPVITIALSPKSVGAGGAVKIYGTVSPKAKGQKVIVQRKSGSHWKTLGTAKLKVQKLPNGKKTLGYVLTYTTNTKGKFVLRATRARTKSLAAGGSKSVALKVT